MCASPTHTHRQGWSEAHQIPTASWRGRSVAPGSFTKGDMPQAWHGSSGRTGSSIPSSPLQQHTCPMSAAPGTSTETSTLVLHTDQVKNLNFTKYALKKEEKLKNKKTTPQKILNQNSQTWVPFYGQYSTLLLGHLTEVPGTDGEGDRARWNH